MLVLGRTHLVREQMMIDIVLQRRREKPICLEMMAGYDFGIQGIDNDRHYCDDSFVDGADKPCRPASLRAARHNELVDIDPPSRLAGHELLNGVHCPDPALDHRQSD